MSLEKAKKICKTLVDYYGNNAIDIQGGEPTIFKDIFELVRYCRDIGLIPTLITNGLLLGSMAICKKFKEAGVRDFLVSVHGLGETYNRVVGAKSNASEQQMRGIDNCLDLNIPLRFNCVLSLPILQQLSDIAELAVKKRICIVNYIAFNPFEDQQSGNKRSIENVPKYNEVAKHLIPALDILQEADIEYNVRYFPICMVPEVHRKAIYNFQQLPYDPREWDYASWSWTEMKSQRMKWGDISEPISLAYATYGTNRDNLALNKIRISAEKILSHHPSLLSQAVKVYQKISKTAFTLTKSKTKTDRDTEAIYRDNAKMRAQKQCFYAHGSKCFNCNAINICDGFHGDYATIFGTDEASPITDILKTDDPKYFINEQEKVIV